MTQDSLGIVVILIGGFIAIAALVNKKLSDIAEKSKPSDDLVHLIEIMQAGSQKDREVLLSSLQQNTSALNQRLDTAAKVISDVRRDIGEMSEIGRSMRDLQQFLQSPKLRGNIGEAVLAELLAQMLPKESFFLQHTFRSGVKVDAAIRTSGGTIPIDSKFPMENFRKMNTDGEKKIVAAKAFKKDVKNHIDSISRKYILTDEGTVDFALMYVPSESIYYEIVNDSDLFDYSSSKRVLPVSPTTFYAFLRSILMSFEGQKIEAQAKQILAALRAIQKDYTKVEENVSVLQKHINNASSQMSNVVTGFSQLGQKITSVHSVEEKVEKELED